MFPHYALSSYAPTCALPNVPPPRVLSTLALARDRPLPAPERDELHLGRPPSLSSAVADLQLPSTSLRRSRVFSLFRDCAILRSRTELYTIMYSMLFIMQRYDTLLQHAHHNVTRYYLQPSGKLQLSASGSLEPHEYGHRTTGQRLLL